MAEIYGIREQGSELYFYVGSTKYRAADRLSCHLDQVKSGSHANAHFANKVRKIGQERLAVDVLEVTSEQARWAVERGWVERMVREGHPLVNRIYNGLPYGLDARMDDDERRMTPAEFRSVYRRAHGPSPAAVNPSLQWLADVLHAELRSALDLIVAKYPDDVRRDFAFVQHDAR